jgi:hypothetical protein
MPVSYEFDGNVVRFTCDGELSNPIVREALEAATKEAVFTPGMSILLHDLGSDYRISRDEAYEAARDLNDLMGLYSPHIAVVVSSVILITLASGWSTFANPEMVARVRRPPEIPRGLSIVAC